MEKIAVTGHRPDKLGGYNAYGCFKNIKDHMRKFVQSRNDTVTLISGGALGIDQLWMEVGVELKIPVIAALPFIGYDNKWPAISRQKYKKLLDQCAEVRYICDSGYAAWKLQKRNEWMVDNSNMLVAYWNGTPGGTANCVKYATNKNCNVLIFNSDKVRLI